MFRKRGLTVLDAQRLCTEVCGALCCQGPQVLLLGEDEADAMRSHASRLGRRLMLHPRREGGASLRFPDHEGERCPMLARSGACDIYEARPGRCRAFPEGPRPGCIISSDET